ncbi:hypothetical protein ACHQM5_028048 [Ranunculus cassubicifolius]
MYSPILRHHNPFSNIILRKSSLVVIMNVAVVILAFLVVAAPYAEAITCGQVAGGLSPCLGYLKYGGAIPAGCCPGVQKVNGLAKTTVDRQTACGCLKQLAGAGINPSLASGLPGKCGVSIGYPISRSVDCSKVK